MNRRLPTLVMLSLLSIAGFGPAACAAEDAQRAVLVTGASSGLGRATTELLASRGYFVYAGARKPRDLEELDAIDNVQSIRLDVTVQEEIDAAVDVVRNEGRGLYGLVNNAGVAIFSPLIETEEEDFDFQMDVNVYGPYRVTRAFAPLIIESKGRITTISSISGILSGTLFGPYSMSKHAVEAFGDALAAEMKRFDVHVSLIEPGTYQSNIGDNFAQRIKARGTNFENSQFREEIEATLKYVTENLKNSGDPIEVAEAVYAAMHDDDPKHRYLVVPNQNQAERTISRAIKELTQLNQHHRFSFSREQLIEMLDESLAGDQ